MKNIYLKNAGLLGLLLFLFTSCEKDEERVVAASEGIGATLTASATMLNLEKENAANEAVTFSWTEPSFGYSAAVTNTLQIDEAGDNFTNPKEIILAGGVSSRTYSVIELNALLLSMDLPTDTDVDLEVRLKSQVTGTEAIEPAYSNVISVTANSYALVSFVYVPGAYQGWNPATADSLLSATSNGVYVGVINFPEGSTEFKVTPAKNWDLAYGDAGGGAVSISAGGNLSVPEEGMYRLTFNSNDNTFAVDKYRWGVIGDATPGGWNADTDLAYNNGTQEWTLTTDLTVGALKFRLNDDWGTNYGGSDGNLALGGSDIPITAAGTYKITMNLANNTYSVVKL